ncbi:MAG: hypothetical protein KDD38_01525 [Bdellovibrionales bacterium]|nr:hypothetical protein [Bdellovibrionales bacterium]
MRLLATIFGAQSGFFTHLAVLFLLFTSPVMLYGAQDLGGDARNGSGRCTQLLGQNSVVHQLFDKQKKAIENYIQVTHEKLNQGDILKFSNEAEFVYSHKLGEGFTTEVLAVYPIERGIISSRLYALRIPSSDEVLRPFAAAIPIRSFINKYYDGYYVLQEHNLPIPFLYDHLSEEYNLTELVQYDLTGHDFFINPEGHSRELLQKAERALIQLAKAVAKFDTIGDFKASQIVYSIEQDRWIILDWTDNNILYNGKSSRTVHHPFDKLFRNSLATVSGEMKAFTERVVSPREEKILAHLTEVILEERNESKKSFMQRMLEKFKR